MAISEKLLNKSWSTFGDHADSEQFYSDLQKGKMTLKKILLLILISLCVSGCGVETNTKLSAVANQELKQYTYTDEIDYIIMSDDCSNIEHIFEKPIFNIERICIPLNNQKYFKFSENWYGVKIERNGNDWEVMVPKSFYKRISFAQAKNELTEIISDVLPIYQIQFDNKKSNINSWDK